MGSLANAHKADIKLNKKQNQAAATKTTSENVVEFPAKPINNDYSINSEDYDQIKIRLNSLENNYVDKQILQNLLNEVENVNKKLSEFKDQFNGLEHETVELSGLVADHQEAISNLKKFVGL